MCNFDTQMLCVNNYRGEDYNKPDDCVDCEDCIENPKNRNKPINPNDADKVLQSEEHIKYKKTLQKGINLLKNNPNAIIDILQVSTKLSYLRGRIFEQDHPTKQPVQTESGDVLNKDANCSAASVEVKTDDLRLPKGFKEGKCKCGNSYGYCGIDIGYCVKCLDKLETKPKFPKHMEHRCRDKDCKFCKEFSPKP